MIDEIGILRDTFDSDAPPDAAEEQARAALLSRIDGRARRRRRSLRLPFAVGLVTAAAVVTAFAINGLDRTDPGARAIAPIEKAPTDEPPATAAPASKPIPYLRPVSATQVLQNAAWSAEQEKWVDPTLEQFMYVETLEMRNPHAYEQEHPNGALIPGKAQYRKIQVWDRVDGQQHASLKDGKLVTDAYWAYRIPWATIAGLTTPEKIRAWVPNQGNVTTDPDVIPGQYVLPPAVKAALFRYLAAEPGMKVNPAAVTIDGRPAIGLGRVVDGYLSEELLFDKQTYALLGDRVVAVANHTDRALDATRVIHKGDLFRQVIYNKLIIVDRPGQTD